MKIGVIGDTHNNRGYISKVVNYLISEEEVRKIYHLGDEWEDADFAAKNGAPVVAVPGIFAQQYEDPSIPNQITETINDVKIIMTHDIKDLSPEDIDSNDVILYSHTHNYDLRSVLGKFYLNPGHLKEEYHKDRIATFAVMKIRQNCIKAKIMDINFSLIAEIAKYRITV